MTAWMRAIAALAAALLVGVGLAGCAGDDAVEMTYSGVQVGGTMPELDAAVTLDAPEQFIEVPGARLQVTSVAAASELPGAVAAQIGVGTEPVEAPPGEQFYFAEVRSTRPQNITAESGAVSTDDVAVSVTAFGTGIDNTQSAGCGQGGNCLIVTTGPAGAAPEDVTLDVTIGQVEQQLSLITGEASSPLSYLDVQPSFEPVWWEFRGDPALHDETLAGYVAAVVWSPVVSELAAPAEGNVFVGLDIEALALSTTHDTSDVTLVLDDGTEIEAANDPHGAFEEFGTITWFEVPADTGDFEFSIHLSASGEEIGTATQPVTLVAD